MTFRFPTGFLRKGVIIAVVAWLISSLIFWESSYFPGSFITDGGGPGFYPRLLAVACAVLGVIIFTRSVYAGEKVNSTDTSIRRILSVIVILIIYPFMLRYVGFPISTFIFLLAIICLLRSIKGALSLSTFISWFLPSLLISAVVTAAAYALFVLGAKVMFPRGTLFDFIFLESQWSFCQVLSSFI